MRLHRLQVNAFGPFAGAEEVDFDRLSDSGLFLLHGQTGAGKSSVLDAVCFALYGRVPGPRGAARPHLRSDHASDTARPEVRLEVTLDGRRFEVTRSPEWHRPKKRGDGTTPEKASVTLRERNRGHWETVTTRADEAGHLLQDLLGMRLDQFTKVVLLPQGEFAAFLRADAESRRSLLEQLFATGRFSDVETWLADRRRELGRQVGDVRRHADELLARADEHAAQLTLLTPAEGEAEPGAEAEASSHTPAARLRHLADHAAALAESAAGQAEAATAEADTAATALASARDLVGRQARVAALSDQAAALLAAEPEQQERRDRLVQARRAAPLVPLLVAAARLADELGQATTALAEARLVVPADLATAGRLAVRSAIAERGKELGRLSGAVEVQDNLAEQTAAQQEAEGLARAAARSATAAQKERDQADRRRTTALARLDQLTAAAARRPAAEAVLQDLERMQRAVVSKRRLEAELAVARRSVDERHAVALAAKEHWLGLREERLAGIASELSAALTEGSPCPVCGGTEHPAPAPARGRAVTDLAEEAAQQAAFDADQALAAAREHLSALVAGLKDETDRVGGRTGKELKSAITRAKADLAATVDAAERIDVVREDVRALDGQIAELALLGEQLLADAAAHRATAKAASAQVRRLTARLDRLRGDDPDVPARQARIEAEVTGLTRLMEADDLHERLVTAATAAVTECETAYGTAGFTDSASATAAALTEAEVDALAEQVDRHDDLVTAVRAQLEDPALQAAADRPPPDLAALTAADTAAAVRRRAAEQDHARADSARVALHRLAAELAEHEARSAAVLAESALVDDLARCVEGTGGDNVLRMRLSSYVVAARLEEVAAAATERLLVMSDGRYSLVHSDALAKGGVRSGLGLRVVDEWTGVERDTATLSGGESFLASLALALGLADAVQAEAGGAVMQTLFIDEGFGMLDEETLDEVMNVLDGLREGGRSVGLVSHVADLRSRIGAQLEIRKARGGSRIVYREAGAA